MFSSLRLTVALISGLAALPSAGLAEQFGANQCSIIVASRPSLDEAHRFRRENPHLDIQGIFQSSNGWLALSVGTIEKNRVPTLLPDLKSRRQIPSDSYCSDGDAYVDLVWSSSEVAAPTPSFSMEASAPFDARPLSRDEKYLLQAGTAYLGHYSGLLDGVWGNGTQAAFESYAREAHGRPLHPARMQARVRPNHAA